MNKLILSFLSLYCILGTCTRKIAAQEITFGRISAEELHDEFYDKDSSASALILYDHAKSNFRHLENHGFRVETTRTVRIKIYNQAGSGWGNVVVPLYQDGYNRTETVRDIKGYVYNLENGMIQRDELDKKDIFEEDVSEKWHHVKFAFPKVKASTVVEYQYTLVSPFLFKLEDWEFQHDIPVQWSEYVLTVPAFYEYMILKQGYFDFEIQDARSLNDEQRLGSYTYDNVRYHWAMKDVPAYQEEEYMTTRDDYIAKIIFQLSKVNYPGKHVKDFMTTWPKLVEDLMKLTYFGKNIKKNNTREIVQSLTEGLGSEKDKATAIYEYVTQNFAWNKKNSYAPSTSLNQLLKDKSGNCTDINLLLLNMLKKAEIEAHAVLLSTRQHGKITTSFPLIDQFNYTIVFAQIEGQGVLLDATRRDLPFGMINEACLNGYGLVANEDAKVEQWIDVGQQGVYFVDIYCQLKYDEERGSLTAQVKESFRDYAALRARKLYQEDEAQLYQLNDVQELKIEGAEVKSKPFSLSYTAPYPAEELGSLLYIDAFMMIDEGNPFNAPKRFYPVDFGHRMAVKYNFSFTVPEGYSLEEWPQDINLKLEDSSISYVSKSNFAFNTLQIVSLFQINKTMIGVDQYQDLRELYADMLSKQMEKIVLKKTESE
ncbi:transglutaminase-like putative cysteine protease [Catalinimonas alkaloidigena]|uniref:DUF3857 domain-containing protein n=1 Tax=Catalinimonas alkaloidigena TaxID=1075417 RepID=UPI0024057A7C|nr:DUF3857 domain-containing protein [Catalinimonas alkaloidigena]MDF9796193.1 transglutaminase-like putative cysteine protease [Catalinimonas alkaloidigena]